MTEQAARKWKWIAPAGLMLVGLGLSLTGEAIILKGDDAPVWTWVVLGTLGLVGVNAGLSVFGDAVKRRVWDEILTRERKT
ncbi:MAG: hypothetical protein D6722_17305 [Bacteroidetes bacterium]|nr:MAG: hypothetical protein D6722_17305 [Bacteroidota bacterium]